MAPRKAHSKPSRRTAQSDSDSEPEDIPNFDGDATVKPLFFQAIIACLEDDPVADSLVCHGTASEKGIEYVYNIDHSDNLDADLHDYTWMNPSPIEVTRHRTLPARPTRSMPPVTPARSGDGNGYGEDEEDEPTLEEETVLPDRRLPATRRESKSYIAQLDAKYFSRVAQRITDKGLRTHYRSASGKSLRGLLTVLRTEIQEDCAKSATLRSVLATRRDNHLELPLDAPTTSAFNSYKSGLTTLNEVVVGPGRLSDS